MFRNRASAVTRPPSPVLRPEKVLTVSCRPDYQIERSFINSGEGPFRVPGTRLAKKVRSVRSFQTKPDANNGISEIIPAEEFREFKRPVVLPPNWHNWSRASQEFRAKYGDRGDTTSRATTRRLNPAPGLAQDPPVQAGRVERPAGVGRPGGG